MTTFGVQTRPAQPYVAVVGHVTMDTIPAIADRLGEVFGWLGSQGIPPAAAPFLRYRVIDMAAGLVIEAAVPVAEPVAGAGELVADTVPAGRYVVAVHEGHPDGLAALTGELLTWADRQGLTFDVRATDAGDAWGARLEIYETDPAVEPDPARWCTRLAVRLAEAD